MKTISIWQPWASLIVHNWKFIETRSWAAPASLIGERIGIAATKHIRAEQRAAFSDPIFESYYEETGLPPIEDLPMGSVVGTAILNSCDLITEDDLEDITERELSFGWFTPGRYAWRLRSPVAFHEPVPARGAQGIWDWDGNLRSCLKLV